jgi:hypothetical protein
MNTLVTLHNCSLVLLVISIVVKVWGFVNLGYIWFYRRKLIREVKSNYVENILEHKVIREEIRIEKNKVLDLQIAINILEKGNYDNPQRVIAQR